MRTTIARCILAGLMLTSLGCDTLPKPGTWHVGFDPGQPALSHGTGDLRELLKLGGAQFADSAGEATVALQLVVDPSMAPYTFAIDTEKRGSRLRVIAKGHDTAATLHAGYTALERVGFLFDVTGPTAPDRVMIGKLNNWTAVIEPAVQRRGIRQHLNFPMDISSYSISEAKDYVRNLARLRINHLVLHSYPGHWYAVGSGDRREHGGKFFYGIRYDLPDDPLFTDNIRNDAVFCIPEIEPYYDDRVERGRRAIAWLREVMAEAKRFGMAVRFSVELRTPDLTAAQQICNAVLQAYPDIDELELITPETLHGEPMPIEQVRKGMAAWLRGTVTDPDASALPGFYRTIAASIRTAQALETAHADRELALHIGMYCPAKAHHATMVPIAREFVPRAYGLAIMPAHGGRAVVDALESMSLNANDWRRSMIHSWVEFDGSMYLQQNGIEGIHQLIALARRALGDGPVPGIALNHWRTAENRTVMRYASMAMVHGPIAPETFYMDYAHRLRLGRPEVYASAMQALDDLDTRIRDELFNIGFCYYGVWGRKELGKIGRFQRDRLAAAIAEMVGLEAKLTNCLALTSYPPGKAYLALLVNRIGCTVLHLRAIEKVTELQAFCLGRAPGTLTASEQAQVREICDESLALMREHMELHAQMIVDRGCEGTLINYNDVPPKVVARIRRDYGESLSAERKEK